MSSQIPPSSDLRHSIPFFLIFHQRLILLGIFICWKNIVNVDLMWMSIHGYGKSGRSCLLVCCFVLAHCAACRILVPQPGIEPMLPAVEARSLNCWTAVEVTSRSLRSSVYQLWESWDLKLLAMVSPALTHCLVGKWQTVVEWTIKDLVASHVKEFKFKG